MSIPAREENAFEHDEDGLLAKQRYIPNRIENQGSVRPHGPVRFSSAMERDFLGQRSDSVDLEAVQLPAASTHSMRLRENNTLQSPSDPSWRENISSFWLRNKGVGMMILGQFFGAVMNVITRLLELDKGDVQGMHPFQVRTMVVS